MDKHVQRVESQLLVSISELKKNPSAVIAAAERSPVAVLNHNKVTAYIIRPDVYEHMLDQIDELNLIGLLKERQGEESVAVDINDL